MLVKREIVLDLVLFFRNTFQHMQRTEIQPTDTGDARHKQWAKEKANEAALKAMATQLRAGRKIMNVSVSQLAERVGCTIKNIYHIERAENFPSMPVYLAICRELGTRKPPLT